MYDGEEKSRATSIDKTGVLTSTDETKDQETVLLEALECTRSSVRAAASGKNVMSSTQRRKLEKAQLVARVAELQLELHRVQSALQQHKIDSQKQPKGLPLRRSYAWERRRAEALLAHVKRWHASLQVDRAFLLSSEQRDPD